MLVTGMQLLAHGASEQAVAGHPVAADLAAWSYPVAVLIQRVMQRVRAAADTSCTHSLCLSAAPHSLPSCHQLPRMPEESPGREITNGEKQTSL